MALDLGGEPGAEHAWGYVEWGVPLNIGLVWLLCRSSQHAGVYRAGAFKLHMPYLLVCGLNDGFALLYPIIPCGCKGPCDWGYEGAALGELSRC